MIRSRDHVFVLSLVGTTTIEIKLNRSFSLKNILTQQKMADRPSEQIRLQFHFRCLSCGSRA